jgi:hypothetical protein
MGASLLKWLILLVVLGGLATTAHCEQPLIEGPIEAVDASLQLSEGSTFWTKEFEKATSSFLRLHFVGLKDEVDDDFTIALLNRGGVLIHKYSKEDLTLSDFWTPLIQGDYVRVEVWAAKKPKGLIFSISEIAFHRSGFVKYSLVHDPPELEKIVAYKDVPQIYSRSHAVAKLIFSRDGSHQTCTGFLISDDKFLTNQHCIDRKETCIGNAFAIFGYEETETGMNEGDQFDCLELIQADSELDFALIRLARHPGAKYGFLELSRRPVEDHEQTYLIQHPAGQPKQIARKQCFISTLVADGMAPKADLGHECDTIGGASGSPLLGKDYSVIGLHHLGFDSSGRWKAENRAVQVAKIMSSLNIK